MSTNIFDMINLIASNIWLYGGTFIVVLSLLVFVHELGHYLVAKWAGVRVESFSIGFGKEIWGFNDSHGTRWKLSLFPLGGYVKMFGFEDPASTQKSEDTKDGDSGEIRPFTEDERKVAFFSKTVGQRAAVVIAGPAINFLFAIFIMAVLFTTYGQPVTPPVASAVVTGSAAEQAGIQPHDKILTINGKTVKRFEDIRREVAVALDSKMTLTVLRDGSVIEIEATPRKENFEDRFGFSHSRGLLGILSPSNGLAIEAIALVDGIEIDDPQQAVSLLKERLDTRFPIALKTAKEGESLIVEPGSEMNKALLDNKQDNDKTLVFAKETDQDIIRYNPLIATGVALQETWNITAGTLSAMGQMLTGMRSPTELGGIIRIGAMAGDMAQAGFIALVTFTALLSINLGLINLFPIPTLDGGHLVFYAIEAVKGSPVSENVQEYAFRFGLVILVGIMLFANLNDIVQLVF